MGLAKLSGISKYHLNIEGFKNCIYFPLLENKTSCLMGKKEVQQENTLWIIVIQRHSPL